MEKPLAETRLTKGEYAVAALYFLVALLILLRVFLAAAVTIAGVFTGLVFLAILLFALRAFEVYSLYPDRLVVRKPLAFFKKAPQTFLLPEIEEIRFFHVKGRSVMTFMNITVNGKVRSFQLNESDAPAFAGALAASGVQVINET